MHIEGECHCGAITYEANINPEKVVVCHCTDCQKLSGTAFRTVVFTEDEKFDLKSGELKTYIKIAESGNERIQAFCPNCGSPIYSTSVGEAPKCWVCVSVPLTNGPNCNRQNKFGAGRPKFGSA